MKVLTKITTTLVDPVGQEIVSVSTSHSAICGDSPLHLAREVSKADHDALVNHLSLATGGLKEMTR